MNPEDIIRMAQNAGFAGGGCEALFRFAALVAATEREECAKICEARFMGDMTREDMEARRCAAAIRARGGQT